MTSTAIENIDNEIFEDSKTWKDKLAFLISIMLSPFLVIPLYVLILTSTFCSSAHDFWLYTIIAIFFSTIVPFFHIFLMVKTGRITDIHVAVREERKEPFIVTLASVATVTLILYLTGAPPEISVIGLIMLLNGCIFFLITLHWKISIHLCIFAGVFMTLAVLVNAWYSIAFVFVPLLIWARIQRQRHSFFQGVIATLISALATYLLLKVFGFPRILPGAAMFRMLQNII